MSYSSIAQRIRMVQQTLGLTQEQLAQRLAISQPALSQYLKGRTPPALVLLRLARLGNTTVEWLLTGEDVASREGAVAEESLVYGAASWQERLGRLSPESQRIVARLIDHLFTLEGGAL